MKFHVVSLFPEMIEHSIKFGVTGQAIKKGLVQVSVMNPRQFTKDVHQTVDDKPFGGGDGMLMLSEPLAKSVEKIKENSGLKNSIKVVYLSPQGTLFDQSKAQKMFESDHEFVLICGRYAGVDQRFINQHVDEEISVGDYVLSGGELGALIVMEACFRFVPGVLGHGASRAQDSLTDGLLEAPQWTRPQVWQGESVPSILTDGHHLKIQQWKDRVSLVVTAIKRPDLFKNFAQNESAKGRLVDLLNHWPQLEFLNLNPEEEQSVKSYIAGFVSELKS